MTATYSNRRESVEVQMDGECLGYNSYAKTCVRRTTTGLFAVITTLGHRLIKVLDSEQRARAYNAAISQ